MARRRDGRERRAFPDAPRGGHGGDGEFGDMRVLPDKPRDAPQPEPRAEPVDEAREVFGVGLRACCAHVPSLRSHGARGIFIKGWMRGGAARVIPAKAGIQTLPQTRVSRESLDSRFRGNDSGSA